MIRIPPLLTALLCVATIGPFASAQLSIAPESPRWGESIVITADPSIWKTDAQRFFKSERLYAVVQIHHHIMEGRREALELPLTWDGRRFVGHMAVPENCEAGGVGLATQERYFNGVHVSFMCRAKDGSLPPGARIAGLVLGAREKSNWQRDIEQDLLALRNIDGHGWEYYYAWSFSWRQANTPPEERVREIERVERQEVGKTGPGLVSSLVDGYRRAGQLRKSFDKLKDLCDRFPQSPYIKVGLNSAYALVLEHPEFESQANTLLAQVAKTAPENPALRGFSNMLATKIPGVSLQTMRILAARWMADRPAEMDPHFMLATALAQTPEHTTQAEEEVSKAIELSLRPHAYNNDSLFYRQQAFRLRSELRARRGDISGAIADARMAQTVAQDKVGADDLSREAELWFQLGFVRESEDLAVQAYSHGSLKAEAVLKNAYSARTGSDQGFQNYLINQLRRTDHPTELLSKPVPTFSATTLEGVKIDNASLRGKITVVDFWFTTCPPCRAERPKLNALVDELGDRVRFVGFALDKPEVLKAYLSATPFKYEIVPESESIARSFGIFGYPNHMIIDRSGNIVWLAGVGTDADRIERLRAMIFRLLARDSEAARPKTVSP